MALSDNVQAVMDQVTQLALQAGQQAGALQIQNAVHFQQLAQTASLQLLTGGFQVGQSYQGAHLRRGSEVDSQEAVAEGAVYKGESLASLPQQGLQAVVAEAVAQALAKMANTIPPQTGGYAAQAPGEREPASKA